MVTQLGIVMMVPIFLCGALGVWLNRLTGIDIIFPILLVLGIGSGFRSVYMVTKSFYASDKKKEKIAIIKSLLSTGHYLYSDEIIRSYNLIDIVFKDDKDVRAKWKLYYEALCNESLQYQVRLDKKLDLILAMCKSVNYKNITAQDLQRVYVPKGFAEDGEKQRKYTDMQYQGMELLMQMLQKQAGEMGNK